MSTQLMSEESPQPAEGKSKGKRRSMGSAGLKRLKIFSRKKSAVLPANFEYFGNVGNQLSPPILTGTDLLNCRASSQETVEPLSENQQRWGLEHVTLRGNVKPIERQSRNYEIELAEFVSRHEQSAEFRKSQAWKDILTSIESYARPMGERTATPRVCANELNIQVQKPEFTFQQQYDGRSMLLTPTSPNQGARISTQMEKNHADRTNLNELARIVQDMQNRLYDTERQIEGQRRAITKFVNESQFEANNTIASLRILNSERSTAIKHLRERLEYFVRGPTEREATSFRPVSAPPGQSCAMKIPGTNVVLSIQGDNETSSFEDESIFLDQAMVKKRSSRDVNIRIVLPVNAQIG